MMLKASGSISSGGGKDFRRIFIVRPTATRREIDFTLLQNCLRSSDTVEEKRRNSIDTELCVAIPMMKPTASLKETSSTHLPTVGSIMSRRVITVTMDDHLATIQELFKEHRFHHLLVVEQRKLVGVISDRDLLKALSPNIGTLSETDRDRATLHKRAHQIMSRNPVAATAATPIEAAAKLMIEKKVSCLPITTEENALEGILSWKDIMKALLTSSPVIQRKPD